MAVSFALGSVVLSVVFLQPYSTKSGAFYSMPARAWQLLAGAALQIALVHLLFNVGAVALLFLLPLALRQPGLAHLPVRGAEALADLATRRKALALVYVLGLYFALPAALVFSVGSR